MWTRWSLRDVLINYFWYSLLPPLVCCMAGFCMCICMHVHACPCMCIAWHTVTPDQSPLIFPVLWFYWGILLHCPSGPGVYCFVSLSVKVNLSFCAWQFHDLHCRSFALIYLAYKICLKIKENMLTWSQKLFHQSTSHTKWFFLQETICYKPIQMNEIVVMWLVWLG